METRFTDTEEICREFVCPAETTFQIIGGKWRPRILWQLCRSEQPLRFGELQAALDGISVKTLTHNLRELETMKLVVRRDFSEFPPKVEYDLSDFGKSLKPIFTVTYDWIAENRISVRQIISDNPSKGWLFRKDSELD
jgi:DNA-binding HxlR family transcriptional regulator